MLDVAEISVTADASAAMQNCTADIRARPESVELENDFSSTVYSIYDIWADNTLIDSNDTELRPPPLISCHNRHAFNT